MTPKEELAAARVKLELDERMKKSVEGTTASIAPGPREPRATKEKEALPDLFDPKVRIDRKEELVEMLRDHAQLGKTMSGLKAERELLGIRIQGLIGHEARFTVGPIKCMYTQSTRKSIKDYLLRQQGVDARVIALCTETKPTWTLRVTSEGNTFDENEY